MGLFDRFKAQPIDHPVLGRLERSRGRWRGAVTLPGHAPSSLVLAGGKDGPAENAVDLAVALPERYSSLEATIAAALFEHYEPYREAAEGGELEDLGEGLTDLTSAAEVWKHVSIVAVTVDALAGEELAVEIALEAAWDIEHTLGARFSRTWEFLELCGSVLVTAPR